MDTSGDALRAVLDNVQVPHQPFVLISESATCSGLPIFRDSLRRALARQAPVLLVSVLHPPAHVLAAECSSSTQVVDLTDTVAGFSAASDWSAVSERILSACKALSAGGQVYIDAADVLAEDYGLANVGKLIRSLLKLAREAKAPSRLALLLPAESELRAQLLSPTFSATLVSIHAHHPSTVAHLSKQYLAPVAPSHQFWQILDNAVLRGTGDALTYGGQGRHGDWADASPVAGPSKAQAGVVVQVLVRKATGGTKGISRTLEGLAISNDAGGRGGGTSTPVLEVVPLSNLVPLNPVGAASSLSQTSSGVTATPGGNSDGTAPSAHADLLLPFNLSLTDEQKRRRGEVPVPYAHEGEGVELGFDDEEDEDDEEI